MSISVTDTHNPNTVVPLISVVLPVYNGETYLAEAIDSILLQTFRNFELIIIDDGSTDGSQHILRKYEQSDPRVRLTVRENRGLATTLNDSLDIARGVWIARMDQDDIALPHRFARQLQWLDQTGADICGTWVRRFGTSDKRVVRLRQSDEAIKMEMLFCSPLAHPTVMMRNALVQELRYDKAWEKAEDYDLWERAAEAGLKMTNVPEVLLLYRIHSEQISSRTVIRQLQQAQEIRRRYWEFVFNSMRLNRIWIDETMKIFTPPLSNIDMNAVDASFAELLSRHHGESRVVIFENLIRLYLRVAAHCPNIISRFDKLNREFGVGGRVSTKLLLWLARLLQIDSNGALFKNLKKIYIWRASR